MKSLLSILLLAGTALSFSTSYYGWVPQKEFLYHFETQILTGVTEIRNQFSGLKLSSNVRIQSYPDYSLRIKFESPKFLTVNEDIPTIDGKFYVPSESHQEMPEVVRRSLVAPFEVHFKRGIVETLFVEKDEPVVVTNIKKALLAQLQMDLSGSKEGSVQKLNHLILPQVATAQEEMKNVSFFRTMESSPYGYCETSYTVHPLPLYQAREMEEQWRVHKTKVMETVPGYRYFSKLATNEDVMKQAHLSASICEGKTYFQIIKNKNYENCREKPIFTSISGMQFKCDISSSSCNDASNAISTTRYIACGTPEQFTIRKLDGEQIVVVNPAGWNTKEQLKMTSSVTLEILKVESAGYQPITKPVNPKKVITLMIEYPGSKPFATQSLYERMMRGQNRGQTHHEEFKRLTGFYPVHPMPEMELAPEFLFPAPGPKTELYRQINAVMSKIVSRTYESPESCSSSSDVAGHIVSIAKALRPLSLNEMKEVQAGIINHIQVRNEESLKTAKYLFYDVLTMVGTNPSLVLIKERVENGEIAPRYAPSVLRAALSSVRTPTPELFNMVFSLIKNIKSKNPQTYSSGMISFSSLLYRACVNPTSVVTEFPTHIYGNFCNPETPFIKDQYIPYLESQLETSVRAGTWEKAILIDALGKLGHYKALTPLAKVIEGKITQKPMIRSLAVYSLKRVAIQYPSIVKPVLLSIIDNPGEHSEVRIAAVSVLPFSSPSVADLQKIALRTWFEPSKQVSSFIYSTLRGLSHTHVPELTHFRSKVQNILPMVRRVQSGIQFSHNLHSSVFMKHIKMVANTKLEIVNSQSSLIPSKISFSQNFVSSAVKINGLSFDLYTEGMDYVLQKMISMAHLEGEVSQSVRSELQKIEEKLHIKRREMPNPEAALSVKFMGMERLITFNSEYYMETLQKITEQLRSSPEKLAEGMHFKYSSARKLVDVNTISATDSGFPLYIEMVTPIVFSAKGSIHGVTHKSPETETSSILPNSMKLKYMPIVNVKTITTMGVICPFTKQYIGGGFEMSLHSSLPTETSITYNKGGQIKLSVGAPKEIRDEIELVHAVAKPFTFQKSYEVIVPEDASSGSRIIVSGHELNHYNANPAKKLLGLDTPFKMTTDYPMFDLSTIYKKLRQNPSVSTLSSLPMTSSLRFISLNLKFNPASSSTKELETRFTLARAFKPSPSEIIRFMYPKSLQHSGEIKKMCVENHQSEFEVTECIKEQERSLQSLSDVSHEARRECHHIVRIEAYPKMPQSQIDEEIENCIKSAKVCEAVRYVCGKKSTTSNHKECEEKEKSCIMRQLNFFKTKSILHKLEHGHAYSLSVETSLNTHYDKKSISTVLSAGKKVHNNEIIGFGEMEIAMPGYGHYVVQSESKTKLPAVKAKWDLETLINDDLTYESDVVMYAGRKYAPRESMSRLVAQIFMTKSESQKRSVYESDDYAHCKKEIGEGRSLSPICEKVRHQAVSIDKFTMKVQLPKYHERQQCPIGGYMRNMATALFYPYVAQYSFDTVSSSNVDNLEENEMTLEATVAREGQELQLKYRQHGFQWDANEVRLPSCFKNVLPFSARNVAYSRFIQKSSAQQTPASCRIEDNYISTFDNKTYIYSLNDCEHLLFKDCAGLFPMGVTARGSSAEKEVKIMAGITVITLKPVRGSVIGGIRVNGESVRMTEGQIWTKKCERTGKTVLEIRSFVDGAILVREFESGMEVSFDGKRIEVIAPQSIRAKACGICGDMNGESTADLITPKMCVFKKPRMAAYSYMIQENCKGVPEQDKSEFEKENRQCVKKNVHHTPLKDLTHRVIKVKSGPAGVITKHIVEYRANGNEICFSKNVISVCERKSVPLIGRMSSTPFTCMPAHSTSAKHIKHLINAHEEVSDLIKLPTSYTRMTEQATGCMSASGSSSSSNNGHYSHGSKGRPAYDY